MASRMYNKGMYEIIAQLTNFDTGDIRVLLVDDTYVFSPDHNFVSDVSADEISTTNYARKVLANTSITEDDTGDSVVLDADNVTWTALGPASGGPIVSAAIVYRNTGVDASSPLLSYMDFTDTQVNGGDFTVQFNAAGMIVATSP